MTARFLKAAAVHALTASGIVCALMALFASMERQFETAFLWLGLAFLIDGIDGTFARRYDVKKNTPHVSGETLDLCVDYVTYVFVPVVMLRLAGFLPGWLGIVLAAAILISSLYHFSDLGSKSDDNCFVGFPAIWNIFAFYVFAFALPVWIVAVLIVTFAVLTFVRIKFVHPMRVSDLRVPTFVATGAWSAAAFHVAWQGFPGSPVANTVLALVALYGAFLSLRFGMDGR